MSNDPDYFMFRHTVTEINDSEIEAFTTDSEFSALGVELFKEIGMLLIPIANIHRTDGQGKKIPFTHEEAALIGNLVRYSKLCTAFLEQYTKKRSEICMIIFRSLAETFVNLKYFLNHKDEFTLQHYIKHSLRQEKEFIQIIKRNIQNNGKVEEIEKRMMESIRRSYRDSDFEEEDVNNSSKWESKVKSRIKEILDVDFYVLIYGNASHAVHGNWQDLINFHLEREGDGFLPSPEWNYPTLQILHAATVLSCDLLNNYSVELLPESDKKNELIDSIRDISVRAIKLDRQHEIFMQNRKARSE